MHGRRSLLREPRAGIPADAWHWTSTLLVAVVVLVLQLVPLLLVPELRSTEGAAAIAGLALYPAIFLSAVFAYLHWRLTTSQPAAWLTLPLALLATHGLAVSGIAMSRDHGTEAQTGWFLASDLLVFLALLLTVRLADRVSFRHDPGAAGLLAGGSLVTVHLVVVLAVRPEGQVAPAILMAGTGAIIVIGVLAGLQVLRLTGLPRWASRRLALATVALALWRSMAMPPPADSWPWNVAEVTAATVAATLATCTTLALLRQAIRNDRSALTLLNDRLSDVESEARSDRELLHEVKSTVAGIASASSLLREGALLPGTTRNLLQEMLDVETARLQRLVDARPAGVETDIDLDDVIRPVVVARRALSQDVCWTPTGHHVRGSADDIAEVLTVLLDNAAVHAPGSHVEVEVRTRSADHVDVVVRDDGPGVPADLRSSIFDHARTGPGSRGQGMGLHIARRLARETGHDLRLAEGQGRGAAFVLTLHRAGRAGETATGPDRGPRREGLDAETGRSA